MGEERLSLAMTGELAAAVRAAARAAGLTPAAWVARTIGEHLSTTPRTTPDVEAGPGAWETVRDPTGAFTISLPRGWAHELAVIQRPHGNLQMATTRSPDGATTIITTDPEVPYFVAPSPAGAIPGSVLRPPTPADQFAAEYVHHNFGRQPGFRITGTTEAPAMVELAQRTAQRDNIQLSWATAAELACEYTDGERRVSVVVLVLTAGISQVWYAQVVRIISTTQDAAALVPATQQILSSFTLTDQERQRVDAERAARDAQHRATMQQIQFNTQMSAARHQQNMGAIQSSAQAHQQRMAGLHATWDAQNAGWAAQQTSNDASHAAFMGSLRQESTGGGWGGGTQHQDFLNMIKEERTVVDAHGYEHQVEAGHDKYYYREYDDSWIGLEQHQDIHDVPGINPDDYYETRIQS